MTAMANILARMSPDDKQVFAQEVAKIRGEGYSPEEKKRSVGPGRAPH